MNIQNQINNGVIVSPTSRKPLQFTEDKTALVTADGSERYKFSDNIPFLIDLAQDDRFTNSSMEAEYREAEHTKNAGSKLKGFLYGDLAINRKCKEIMATFDNYSEDSLLLSLGGGPNVDHKLFTNVNISNYPNVHVVADAHHLPYADNSVDGIYINSTIEHLYNPLQAIEEIYRVLKPGGIVFSITPFMQGYHGYPHHYQNLTLTGHEYYFSSKGFSVLDSGTAWGPTVALIIINSKFILYYFPPVINKILGAIFIGVAMLVLKPLDLYINKKEKSHLLASSTYVFAKKN